MSEHLPSPAGRDLQPDRVFRLGRVEFPARRLEIEREGRRRRGRHQAPAEAVVPGAWGQPHAHMGAAGEVSTKGREAPGRRRPAALGGRGARALRQRVRREQRVHPAGRLPPNPAAPSTTAPRGVVGSGSKVKAAATP